MKYSKAVAMVVATILVALVPALAGDNAIDAQEWINVAIVGVGAAAVFAGPNVPGAKYTKLILAALSAVLVLLVSFISDNNISTSEVLQLVVAALGALGVYAVPNKGSVLNPDQAV
jgi:hypothetical protein